MHGITREQLERDGLSIAEVIDALSAVIYGGVILSDAPRHDNKWLADLYRAGGYNRAPFALDDLEHSLPNLAKSVESHLKQPCYERCWRPKQLFRAIIGPGQTQGATRSFCV